MAYLGFAVSKLLCSGVTERDTAACDGIKGKSAAVVAPSASAPPIAMLDSACTSEIVVVALDTEAAAGREAEAKSVKVLTEVAVAVGSAPGTATAVGLLETKLAKETSASSFGSLLCKSCPVTTAAPVTGQMDQSDLSVSPPEAIAAFAAAADVASDVIEPA